MINNLETEIFYNVSEVNEFYKLHQISDFQNLTKEKIQVLDKTAAYWRNTFLKKAKTMKELIAITTSRFIYNPEAFALADNREAIYFFIKVVDPTYECLMISETITDNAELFNYFKKNWGFYDTQLIQYEKMLMDYLKTLKNTQHR